VVGKGVAGIGDFLSRGLKETGIHAMNYMIR
jgi:hypothetical protein